MKTTDIRTSILNVVGQTECYGYEIHRKLASQGERVDIGRLYKILKDMLTEGVLICRWEKSKKGPEKRIYKLSEKGKKEFDDILLTAIETVHSFYSRYLLNLPSEKSIFEDFAKMVAPKPEPQCRVALFAPRFSIMHKRILLALQKRLIYPEICIVQPNQTHSDIDVKNAITLNGNYDSIPLKAKYIDLLILEGLPSSQTSRKAVKEWSRVLKDNGTLVAMAPRAVFSKLKDPLTIGDFVEKMEHQMMRNEEMVNGDSLQQLLRECFKEVQKKEMLQMVVLISHETAHGQTSS